MEQCLEIIRHNRHALAIDGIKYVKLDGKEYYAQEIFDSTELVANLDNELLHERKTFWKENDCLDRCHIFDEKYVKPMIEAIGDSEEEIKSFLINCSKEDLVYMSEFLKIYTRGLITKICGSFLKKWNIEYDKERR